MERPRAVTSVHERPLRRPQVGHRRRGLDAGDVPTTPCYLAPFSRVLAAPRVQRNPTVEVALRIVGLDLILAAGPFAKSKLWKDIEAEIRAAVQCVDWPPGSGRFTIYPQSGKKRGEGNGVVPIKRNCVDALRAKGWVPEHDDIDMAKPLPDGRHFTLEWETGNISSSHRAMNKMARGMLAGAYAGGILVIPTKRLQQYLTDRIGNYEELAPYFAVWAALPIKDGVLGVIRIEQDAESVKVPRIPKATDGRARE